MTANIHFETAAIHAGQDPDPTTGAAVVPIYQTSTYVQQAVGKHKGFEYSRTDNPTRHALETCLGALEGQAQAIAFGSGMAAIATLAMTLRSGDRVVISDDVYGGTYRLFARAMADLGIGYATVDLTDLDAVRGELGGGGGMLLAETPTNPALKILDLEALASLAADAGAIFAVDNTFATAYLQRPFDAWLLLRGLKTLGIRMRAHSAGAGRIAAWLRDQPSVARVLYPGFSDFPGHELAAKQMSGSGEPLFGGMVSIELGSEKPRELSGAPLPSKLQRIRQKELAMKAKRLVQIAAVLMVLRLLLGTCAADDDGGDGGGDAASAGAEDLERADAPESDGQRQFDSEGGLDADDVAAEEAAGGGSSGVTGAMQLPDAHPSIIKTAQLDIEVRLRNFEAQEAVLLRLMDRAETVSDTIKVQRELTGIQLEVERIRGRLRFLEDQTSLGTVTVKLTEPGAVVAKASTIEKAWQRAGDTALAFVSGLVVSLGVIIPSAVLLALAFMAFKLLRPRFTSAS